MKFIQSWSSEKKCVAVGLCLSLIFGALTLIKGLHMHAGWGDEIAFVDIAANYVLFGEWISYNCMTTQESLYVWLLVPWILLFGVSRLSTCAFGVFLAIASVMAVVVFAVKRGLFRTVGSVVLFSVLLWGGGNFVWTVVDGRLDMLICLLSLLAVSLLLRESVDERITLVGLAIAAFFIIRVTLYTIPLLFFLGLLLLVIPPSGVSRKTVLIRGVSFAVGALLGYVVSQAFNFYHHRVLYQLYKTFMCNSHASGVLEGSAEVFPDCYWGEPFALSALLAAMIVIAASQYRGHVKWQYLFFVLAIPGLMVLAGRYAFYYHWLFYLPTAVVVAFALSCVSCGRVRAFILAVALVSFAWSQYHWFKDHAGRPFRHVQQNFEMIVGRHLGEMPHGADIILSSDAIYYSAFRHGWRPWMKVGKEIELCRATTSDNINALIAKKIKNKNLLSIVKSYISKYEITDYRKLPESGFVYSHTLEHFKLVRDVMSELGYRVDVLEQKGECTLARVGYVGK